MQQAKWRLQMNIRSTTAVYYYYVEEVGQLKSHIPLSDSSVLQFS